MLKWSLVLWWVVVLAACNTTPPAQHPYTDSKAYFESEARRLTGAYIKLQKELVFDEQHQLTQPDSINWKKELEPFFAIDLCKAGYAGRFTADTLHLNALGYTLQYKAKDTQTDLRVCSITFHREKIVAVQAVFGSNNTLYNSTKEFSYKPDSGYVISGYQHVTMGNPIRYKIKGNFVSP